MVYSELVHNNPSIMHGDHMKRALKQICCICRINECSYPQAYFYPCLSWRFWSSMQIRAMKHRRRSFDSLGLSCWSIWLSDLCSSRIGMLQYAIGRGITSVAELNSVLGRFQHDFALNERQVFNLACKRVSRRFWRAGRSIKARSFLVKSPCSWGIYALLLAFMCSTCCSNPYTYFCAQFDLV